MLARDAAERGMRWQSTALPKVNDPACLHEVLLSEACKEDDLAAASMQEMAHTATMQAAAPQIQRIKSGVGARVRAALRGSAASGGIGNGIRAAPGVVTSRETTGFQSGVGARVRAALRSTAVTGGIGIGIRAAPGNAPSRETTGFQSGVGAKVRAALRGSAATGGIGIEIRAAPSTVRSRKTSEYKGRVGAGVRAAQRYSAAPGGAGAAPLSLQRQCRP